MSTNWKKSSRYARIAINYFKIHTYPINILNLIKKLKINGIDIEMFTYKQIEEKYNKSEEWIIKNICISTLGCTKKVNDTYMIIYQDDINKYNPQMIRFTIAHEIGHILLEHFDNDKTLLCRGGLSELEYDDLEKEADNFAAELLSPIELVNPNWNVKKISNAFDISKEASEIRYSIIQNQKWLYGYNGFSPNDFIFKGKNSLPEIFPYSLMTVLFSNRNYIICNDCHNITSIFWDSNKYCSVCGSKNIINYKEGNFYFYERILKKSMVPNYIQINDQSIVSICPNCNFENENYSLICPICGFYLQNKCSGISLSEYNHITKEIHDINNDFEWLNEFKGENLKPGSLIIDNIDKSSSNKVHNHDNDRFLPGYANFCFECGRMSTFYLQNI